MNGEESVVHFGVLDDRFSALFEFPDQKEEGKSEKI